MSLQTTATLLFAPAAADMLAIADSGGSWTPGAWVEFIASTTDSTTIAGVAIDIVGGYADMQVELEVGVGAISAEVPIGRIRIYGANNSGSVPGIFFPPVLIGGIAAGSRVSLRLSRNAHSAVNVPYGLYYYYNFDGDNVTTDELTDVPLSANAVAITPNAVAWTWSAWFELFAGVGHQIAMAGLAMRNNSADNDIEYQLGFGAAGSEVGATILRSATEAKSQGLLWYVMLPAIYPVDANTRIAVRIRKTGTNTDAHNAALLMYDDTILPPPVPPPTPSNTFTVRCERVFLLPTSPSYRRMFIGRLEFLIQQGVGYGAGQGMDPQVMVSISRDGGHSFGPEFLLSVGKVGEYLHRSYRNAPNGYYRNGAIKISTSDPNFVAWLGASADITEGLS